jgi:hypothetical protein
MRPFSYSILGCSRFEDDGSAWPSLKLCWQVLPLGSPWITNYRGGSQWLAVATQLFQQMGPSGAVDESAALSARPHHPAGPNPWTLEQWSSGSNLGSGTFWGQLVRPAKRHQAIDFLSPEAQLGQRVMLDSGGVQLDACYRVAEGRFRASYEVRSSGLKTQRSEGAPQCAGRRRASNAGSVQNWEQAGSGSSGTNLSPIIDVLPPSEGRRCLGETKSRYFWKIGSIRITLLLCMYHTT